MIEESYYDRQSELDEASDFKEDDNKSTSSSDSNSNSSDICSIPHLSVVKIQKDENYNNRIIKINEFIKNRNIINIKKQINSIVGCDMTCVSGKTGCGKSTIVPLGIYAHNDNNEFLKKIVVLEPTRVSTTSLCTYLCTVIKEPVGESFGFKTSGNSSCSDKTSLIVMTYGYFLMIISDEKYLDTIDYIILDEVHILDSTIQTLLVILQSLKKQKKLQAKIVFMSATVDQKLEKYMQEKFVPSKYIKIELSSEINYKVRTTTIQQISGSVSLKSLKATLGLQLISSLETDKIQTNTQLAAVLRIVKYIDDTEHEMNSNPDCKEGEKDKVAKGRGGILIFVPGEAAMTSLVNSIQKLHLHKNIHIECLSSKISSDDQWNIVISQNFSQRIVIVSTPVSESSLTIRCIDYVIDTCVVNSLEVDIGSGTWELKSRFITPIEAKQRQGRLGRVSDGHWFGLVGSFTNQLAKHANEADLFGPDIMQSFLLFKKFKIESSANSDTTSVFDLCVYGPAESSIINGIGIMKSQGLLSPWVNSTTFTCLNGDVSVLGNIIQDLPINKCYGKLVIMGLLLNELDACSALAAILSNGDLADQMLNVVRRHSPTSDFITLLLMYNDFLERNMTCDASGKTWAAEFRINVDSLHHIKRTVQLTRLRLHHAGFVSATSRCSYDVTVDTHMIFNRIDLLRACIAGGLYPYYYTTGSSAEGTSIKSISLLRGNATFRPTKKTMLQPYAIPPNRQVICATSFGRLKQGELILRQLELFPADSDYIGIYSLLFCKYGTVFVDPKDKLKILQYGLFGLGNVRDNNLDNLNLLNVGHELDDFCWPFNITLTTDDIVQFNHLRDIMSKALLEENREQLQSFQKFIFGSLILLMLTPRNTKQPILGVDTSFYGTMTMSSSLEDTFPPITIESIKKK